MAKYIIEGGQPLQGEITANSGKNYVLPVMAATLLTNETCVLRNVPKIRDVEYMVKLLEFIGSTVTYLDDTTLQIQTKEIKETSLPKDLVKPLRASVVLLGPLLAKTGKATMYHPGGDVIGRRSIDTHLLGFEQLGVTVERDESMYHLACHALSGNSILDEVSVTATENLVIAAAGSSAPISIKHAATEPHVQELCKVLQKMGARIEGIGTNKLIINGSDRLGGFDHTFGADHLEVGTWIVLAGVTQSQLRIKNVNKEYLDMILLVFKRFGLDITFEKQELEEHLKFDYEPYTIVVHPQPLQAVAKVDAFPWPGFPTDLISLVIVLATQAQGITLIRDMMYESRMFFVDKLIGMRANIVICDPHRVIVYGKTQLVGKYLESPDVRAGMAMVLAALVARGESVISNVEHVERDYADVVSRLTALGAKITRVEE